MIPYPALAFLTVGNLLAPPPSVMHPRVALRVLWGNLRSRPKPQAIETSMQGAAGGD